MNEIAVSASKLFAEPKIDCHCHIFDPSIFPYNPASKYHPSGQEIGTAVQIAQVFDTYGVQHALLVQPNSGYGDDNRCLLAAIAASSGRYKGVAVVRNNAGIEELAALKEQGIVGVAFNLTFHGIDYYLGTEDLLAKLAELDMYLQLQVEDQQLISIMALIHTSSVRILIDHCGRPPATKGLDQPGFRALLNLAERDDVAVKLSGYMKFSSHPHPFVDTWPYIQALVNAFGLERCMWASDWPYLRATERYDYGPLVMLIAKFFPDEAERRMLFWDTPQRLFGFGG